VKESKMEYVARRQINDLSRTTAEAHRELWAEHEIEFLEKNWSTDWEVLQTLAVCLGRTVEACRQKHYDLGVAREHAAKTKKVAEKVTAWSQGFTSLEEMGY
jgi:hypothetical protein